MRKIAIEDLIQLLGMVGIIGSLVFVGLEMRQSQRIAIAGQQLGRSALFGDLINAYTEAGGDIQSLYFEEKLNYTLTPEEVIYRNGVHSAWLLYENDFYQYSQGLMEDDVWQAKQRGIELLYNRCFARGIYETRAPIFSEKFQAIIEQIPDECSDDT